MAANTERPSPKDTITLSVAAPGLYRFPNAILRVAFFVPWWMLAKYFTNLAPKKRSPKEASVPTMNQAAKFQSVVDQSIRLTKKATPIIIASM